MRECQISLPSSPVRYPRIVQLFSENDLIFLQPEIRREIRRWEVMIVVYVGIVQLHLGDVVAVAVSVAVGMRIRRRRAMRMHVRRR